ncbi:pseudouridine synthase [Podospora fimiseda]|uniref:tRNA pseudouridine(55) synthase n=1 Tax=Podospora fimiseda TaxID=252190 RepID=A0AAN7BLG5_9PEZI|nr:pseudouridine synthase [Podospora fimiseda]
MRFPQALKMAGDKILEGVFAINKPVGMSSAQVIRDCQNLFNPSAVFAPLIAQEKAARDKESKYQKKRRGRGKQEIRVKMGHGGTLDPLATGVLILGVGKGTKSLSNFLLCTKTYETVVVFGASTDTYDRVGKLIKKGNYDNVTREVVENALGSFRGKYRQMPPLYSALKMEGKPLYEYAREGKPIPREIETREVDVTELEIVEWYEPGTHNHRWPTEEAGQAEKALVGSVWDIAKSQASGEKPDEAKIEKVEQETKALEDYNSKKREAEERIDEIVTEGKPAAKRAKAEDGAAVEPTTMSGALKVNAPPKGRGSDLVPPPPSADEPFPWEGKGPPACKIKMTVTSGFYVRSLCHDLGEKIGCGAMMAELARTRQGQFVLGTANCMEYDDLLKGEEVWGPKVENALELWNNPGKAEAERQENLKEEVETEEQPVLESAEQPASTTEQVTGEAAQPEAVAA